MALDEFMIHKALLEGKNVLDDEITRDFHCELNPISAVFGDPDRLQAMHERGNFCLSFKFWKNGDNVKMKPKKCVRVWQSNTIIDKERFRLISNGLIACDSPYFTKFIYKERGLNVNGNIIPAIIMDWIDGMTMTTWIPANKNTPQNIGILADNFMEMSCKLNDLGIAHGDLCSENILVTPSCEIKLVDYDSVYVSTMDNRFHTVTAGWPDFQHPKRINNNIVTAQDDYFSQHVIYFSLLAYSRFPQLIPDKAEKSLLFTSPDYQSEVAFVNSNTYRFIMQHCKTGNAQDNILLNELDILRHAIIGKIDKVPSLKNYRSDKVRGDAKKGQQEVNDNKKTKVEIPNTTTNNPTPKRPVVPVLTNTSTPWYKKWYAWACALVIAIGIGYVITNGTTSSSTSTDIQTAVNVGITKAIHNLEGNYTLREKNGSTPVNGIHTAAIKKLSDSQARILVTSEYGPDFYDFTYTSDGKVQSKKMGTGEIIYNERLDKITIIFKQGERICEFTK